MTFFPICKSAKPQRTSTYLPKALIRLPAPARPYPPPTVLIHYVLYSDYGNANGVYTLRHSPTEFDIYITMDITFSFLTVPYANRNPG
jgi:hypothetical protein